MNDLPRQELCKIIAQHDHSLCENPQRTEALLRDFCGEYKREISVLVSALRERVAADLLASQEGVPCEVLLARLTKRLQDNRALTEDAARWAVESWALALGVVAPEQIIDVSRLPLDRQPEVAGRVFTSTRQLDVLGRPRSRLGDEWQTLGSTPGTVTLPPDYDLGIGPRGVNDDALEILVQELADSGPIQLLDLSSSPGITDAGLAHLKVLTCLTSLDLWKCRQITDAGLAHLKALTSLTNLDLGRCEQITDTGLAHLKALTNLTSLDLGWCNQITDAGLAHLKALTGLTNLDLSSCKQITDAGLAHLKALTSLTNLNLWRCKQITDAGLAHLRSLTNLTSLNLRGCKQITDAGVASLKRPGLDIRGY